VEGHLSSGYRGRGLKNTCLILARAGKRPRDLGRTRKKGSAVDAYNLDPLTASVQGKNSGGADFNCLGDIAQTIQRGKKSSKRTTFARAGEEAQRPNVRC